MRSIVPFGKFLLLMVVAFGTYMVMSATADAVMGMGKEPYRSALSSCDGVETRLVDTKYLPNTMIRIRFPITIIDHNQLIRLDEILSVDISNSKQFLQSGLAQYSEELKHRSECRPSGKIRALMEKELCEFNHRHAQELAQFYNPGYDQNEAFNGLIQADLEPAATRCGLVIHQAWLERQ